MAFSPNSEPKQHPSCMRQGLHRGKKCVILSLFVSDSWISPFALISYIGVSALTVFSVLGTYCFHLVSQLCHARCCCPILPSHLFLLTFCHSLFLPSFIPVWLLPPSGPSYLAFCNRKKSHTENRVILLTPFLSSFSTPVVSSSHKEELQRNIVLPRAKHA